jgi:hypothetical protein
MKKLASGLMIVLFLCSVLVCTLNVRAVRADGPIYIRADGSIDPPTAPIFTANNITYILSDNISSVMDGIVIERPSNIIIDGNGCMLQGSGGGYGISTSYPDPSKVVGVTFTIENLNILNFSTGIYMGILPGASVAVSKNNMTGGLDSYYMVVDVVDNNIAGIVAGDGRLSLSGNNINGSISAWCPPHGTGPGGLSMSGNNVTGSLGIYGDNGGVISGNNIGGGVYVDPWAIVSISGNNIAGGIGLGGTSTAVISRKGTTPSDYVQTSISENNITSNYSGAGLSLYQIFGFPAMIFGNNIFENDVGISIAGTLNSGTYAIYNNNFFNNTNQVVNPSNNQGIAWDNGYPSGGNYWGDYNGTDFSHGLGQNKTGSDGIGDTPYIIDANNTDHYPLMNPYSTNSLSTTVSPTLVVVDVGQSQTFKSTVSGGALAYSYQWYLNGAPQSDAATSAWTFTPPLAGSYIQVYVKVNDSNGTEATSNIATVNVNDPPSVSISPSSVVMHSNHPQNFSSIVADGTSPYTYQWYLNGTAVPSATHSNWTFTPTSAGLYTVYANITDSVGMQATSNNATVTVIEFHDVAATDVASYKTVVGQGFNASVDVTLVNEGDHTETFNVTAYANTTEIGTQEVITLLSGNSTQLVFMWNTTGFAYGNYTLSVYALPFQGETNIANNNASCPVPVHIGVPGDVSSSTLGVYDGTTNMKDIAYLILLFSTRSTSSNWNPNADVNNDGVCNMKDIAIAVLNFYQHE